MEEEWRDIPTLNGRYQVSNFGRVRSVNHLVVRPQGNYMAKGRLIKGKLNRKTGYISLCYWVAGEREYIYVHRAVALAFLPNPNNLPFVNHKDENPQNNHVDNLEWCTHEYNCNYGTSKSRMIDKMRKYAVYQCTLEGRVIALFASINEAARFMGVNSSLISRACRGQSESVKGFRWSFVDRTLKEYAKRQRELRRSKFIKIKAVEQYSLDGVFISRYDSCAEATRVIYGRVSSKLPAILKRGEHFYRGFYFKYAEE